MYYIQFQLRLSRRNEQTIQPESYTNTEKMNVKYKTEQKSTCDYRASVLSVAMMKPRPKPTQERKRASVHHPGDLRQEVHAQAVLTGWLHPQWSGPAHINP